MTEKRYLRLKKSATTKLLVLLQKVGGGKMLDS